jgi:hypothetical protein
VNPVAARNAAPVSAAPPTAMPPTPAGRTARLGEQSLARAALTFLAEPGDPALGALLGICEPAEVLAAIKADMLPGTGPGCGDSPASRKALEPALGRWRARLPGLPHDADVAAACRDGIRLVCPQDPQWPERLDELGRARPYALRPRRSALGLPAVGVGSGLAGRHRVRRARRR